MDGKNKQSGTHRELGVETRKQISWLGYFHSAQRERAFRIEYHRRTWLRRMLSSLALLAVQAWFLGQYIVSGFVLCVLEAGKL